MPLIIGLRILDTLYSFMLRTHTQKVPDLTFQSHHYNAMADIAGCTTYITFGVAKRKTKSTRENTLFIVYGHIIPLVLNRSL